jgi:hypothetical protein
MAIPIGLRGTNSQIASPPYTNGPYTWDQDLTLSGTIAISGTLTLTGKFTRDSDFHTATNYDTAGAIDANDSFVTIDPAATSIAMTIAAPAAGRSLIISQNATGTATVTLTSGTYDGSATVATFNATAETLVLFGLDTDRFVVVENIGTVALS